ncbi:MAG: hypothetical protein IT204_08130 [Fimbriimonadaceae bacterium]|nr:hypothetical protein [Fimbriimonadaceae bacterium]
MAVQAPLRAFLVTLAALLAWRLGQPAWASLGALLVLLPGWLCEAALVARCAGAGSRELDLRRQQPDLSRLRSTDGARTYPWLLASLAVLAGTAGYLRPDLLPATAGLGLLVLAHPTAFRAVQRLTWPAAAARVEQAWGVPPWPRLLAQLWAAKSLLVAHRGLLSGELQCGEPQALAADLRPQDVLRIAAALLRPESTPLAAAVVAAARAQRLALPNLADALLQPLVGRRGTFQEQSYELGGGSLLSRHGLTAPPQAAPAADQEPLWLLRDGALVGCLPLTATPLPGAETVATAIRRSGVGSTAMLTDGDPQDLAALRRQLRLGQVIGPVGSPTDEVIDHGLAGPVIGFAPPGVEYGVRGVQWLGLDPAASAPTAEPLLLTRPEVLPVAWQAAREALVRDSKLSQAVWTSGLLAVVAAGCGLPLTLLVAADELLLLAVLRTLVRAAESPAAIG